MAIVNSPRLLYLFVRKMRCALERSYSNRAEIRA